MSTLKTETSSVVEKLEAVPSIEVAATSMVEPPASEPWRRKNPSFRDKEVFDEYMKILEDQRNEPFPDEIQEA